MSTLVRLIRAAFSQAANRLKRATCDHEWNTIFRGIPGIPFTYPVKKCSKCGAEDT